ncbi:type IV secretory system conjugative DNA transfer family protein [Bradyrhizobium guangxiense]
MAGARWCSTRKARLYEETSAWRAKNVGPVYRIAPFDDGTNPATRRFPRHGFNPLARIRSQHQARGLAQLMFPRDPNGQEFFNDDVVGFLTGVILYILDSAPERRRNLGTVREATAAPLEQFKKIVRHMAESRLQAVREAADNAVGKSGDRGLPNLRDTLHSKLSLWSDPALIAATDRNDVDFASLKDRPATVYITVPFNLLEPYAPFVKVLLKHALDAMLDNPAKPEIPVLFVLDEFLSLGPFADFRNAIRTHASAGVRLWFFLQDMGTLEEHYPGKAWQAFLNTSVKQFFGIDDPFTAEARRPLSRQPDCGVPERPDQRQRVGPNGQLVRGRLGGRQPVERRVHPVSRAAAADAGRGHGPPFRLARERDAHRHHAHPGAAGIQGQAGTVHRQRRLQIQKRSLRGPLGRRICLRGKAAAQRGRTAAGRFRSEDPADP